MPDRQSQCLSARNLLLTSSQVPTVKQGEMAGMARGVRTRLGSLTSAAGTLHFQTGSQWVEEWQAFSGNLHPARIGFPGVLLTSSEIWANLSFSFEPSKWGQWGQCVCVSAKLLQLCPTLWDPVDCPWDSPGNNTGVAISFSRGSFQPKNWTHISCIGRQVIYL